MRTHSNARAWRYLVAVPILMTLACRLGLPIGNHAPQIDTQFQTAQTVSSNLMGEITAVQTVILIHATDADSDPLSYEWKASNGSIRNNGINAVWNREIQNGDQLVPGVVTVVVSDNHGGRAVREIEFK